MSINLIESKRTSQQSVRGTIVSIAVHASVITLAVIATASAGEIHAATPEILTPIHAPSADKPPAPRTTPHAPHPDDPRMRTPPHGVLLVPPVDIPNTLPPIEASTSMTAPESLFTSGTRGTGASVTGSGVDAGQPYFESQVEKPALPRSGNPSPSYPSMFESSRIEGTVLAQFVVDTLGRADMRTFRVLESTNDLFSASVRGALAKWRFYPAEAGGRRVAQRVQLPLKFVAPAR